MKFQPIVLPLDGKPHKCVVEWWYYNGFLTAEDGHRFAYMCCLFQVDNKKVNIPLLSRLPVKTVYFSHSLLTDIDNQKFYPTVDYYSVISKDSFKRPLFYANFTNPLAGFGKYVNSAIEEEEGNSFHLKRNDLDLKLTSKKPVLLEGGDGFVKLHERSTYYYSFTNLETEGLVLLDGKVFNVKGKSWMDHQWANNRYTQERWTWFSIQLENNVEIVCFEYEDQGHKDYLASIIYADNHQVHCKNVKISPFGDVWKSKTTGANYNLSWKIEVPEREIELLVTPLVKNQEMVFGSINYWEGPLKVGGKIGKEKVSGQGFMELVGNPIEYGVLKLTTQILKNIKAKVF